MSLCLTEDPSFTGAMVMSQSGLGTVRQSVKDHLEVNQVRIIPSQLTFSGAYDGKKFIEKFTIINIGKYPAFVRVFPTTSKAFKMKPLPKGRALCSGMSLVRYITYRFNTAIAIPQVYLYIYINETPVLYPIEVQVGSSLVKISPRMLHFGDIDIGTSSQQLSVFLNNQGQRIAHFSVDLGRNDLESIVDPMRGTIQPKSTQEIKVEILGSRQGHFLKEFWIKTEPLQRIWLTGTFIQPKLKIDYPLTSNFELIVIDFPKTYYNAQNKRIVIIQNMSSTNSMFCTLAEYKKNEDIKLDQARALNENLNFFKLSPKEGRLTKNHKAAVTVTFAPYRVKTFPQKYCIIFVKIMKINYRDGIIKGKDINVKTFSSATEADQYQIADIKSTESVFELKWETAPSYLRICLYGEIEETSVKLTPSSIDRESLNVGEEVKLTFNFKNQSKHLPITFKYEKVACFEMQPRKATLSPDSSVDILILLTPHSMGSFTKKINLVLYYTNRDGAEFKVGSTFLRINYTAHGDQKKKNIMLKPKFTMGITSPYVHGAGHMVDDVRYNTVDLDDLPVAAFVNETKLVDCCNENNTNLIAFPNDRPRWHYPWRNEIPCTTIFAHLPRFNNPFDYTHTYTPSELEFKTKNKNKFTEIMRKEFKPKEENVLINRESCYPTNPAKRMLTNEKVYGCLLPFSEVLSWPKFIPLTPEELIDIEITPRYVVLGKIAPHIVCSDFFEIKNNNSFPVIIAIVALSNCVIVKGKKRITINGKKSARLYFDCYSHGLGKYYVPVYIIINDYHIFDATVFAEVVPTTVKCKHKEVLINAKDNVGYLELFNPVNCAIDFAWDVQDKNYEIIPSSGKIESRKSLYCKIIFTPRIESVFKTEMYLLSQSGAKQIVRVENEQIRPFVRFSTLSIEMKHIPLNITVSRRLVVRNESEQAIVLYVKNPNPIEQISITPKNGFIEGKCDIFFKVTAHFKTIKNFTCNMQFVLLDGREYTIHVYGNVTFPNIILEPEFMHIPKVVTSAFQRRVFRISNNCWAVTKVKFLIDSYSDLTVTDLHRKKIDSELTLNPKDFVELYLEFQPKEPTAYTLYLPYVLNGIVGPPLLNNPNSFKIGTYLEPPSVEITRAIPTLRITCAAGTPWFKFSSMKLIFTDEDPVKDFLVKNISTAFHKVKFQMDELPSCFTVRIFSCTGKFKVIDNLIKVSLEPQEKVVFQFGFNTVDYGTYEGNMPFYVKHYFDNCPFNYIRLHGSKYKPLIEAKNRMISMPTIPVKKVYIRSKKINLYYHKPNCVISLQNNHEFLRAEIKQDSDKTIDITISFYPKDECEVESDIILTCTCGASCTLVITAACDNCSLLSYRHKMKWWSGGNLEVQESLLDHRNKSSIKKIEILNEILEKYIFTQGFFSTYYYKIPSTISKYPYNLYATRESKVKLRRSDKNAHLPIVMFFRNLSSPSIVSNLTDGVNFASLDDRQGAAYDYNVYKNVLRYLEDYHVFVKNICPEYLLNYERYVVFKTQLIDESSITGDEIIPEEEFNNISKQCWLDLIVKIYKLLHYDRLLKDIPPKTGRLEVDDVYQQEFGEYYASQIESFPAGFNECEAKLMLWVEFHFKHQKEQLWPEKEVPDRKIRDLSKDLRDSLPLATLMAAYCPYLADTFREIYLNDTDVAATGHCPLHHNACLISEAWNRLQLSFKISTNSIFEPINTEMLFLLAYLYIILPNFYPLETVTIKSHLGKTSSAKVLLRNTGPVAISFTAILFLNQNESFQIDSNNIIIPGKGEKDMMLSYTGKQIIKEEAVLVLSGETGGQKFSKSMAINVIGIPDILYFTQEFKLKIDLYETITKTIDVISPYAQPYFANTYFYLFQEGKPPLTMSDFVSISALPGLPRQLELDGVCAFNEEGMLKLNTTMCFISLGDFIYYVYFTNKEVGIFCIKIHIRTAFSDQIFENIPVKIQTNFDSTAPCICKANVRNLRCPRILFADIPFQNQNLIRGLRDMIKIYARPDEVEFWNIHLVFPKGFHIFRTYLENTYDDDLVPFKRVLHPMVKYKTSTDGRRFSVEEFLKFNDTTSEGTCRMMIHWDSSEYPEKETLYLLADHSLEPRAYYLRFWSRETRL